MSSLRTTTCDALIVPSEIVGLKKTDVDVLAVNYQQSGFFLLYGAITLLSSDFFIRQEKQQPITKK